MKPRTRTHDHHRLSLVVETDDPAMAICDFVGFAAAGFDVVVCSGPTGDRRCAAIDGQVCEAIAGADVVLNAIRDPETQKAVLEATHAFMPSAPMVVCTPADDLDLPSGCVPLRGDVSVSGQTAILRRTAVAHRHA
jgi:hypothetical protein